MNTQRFDVDDGYEADAVYRNPMNPAFPDQLGVLSSTRAVVELGELVWINRESVNALQEKLMAFARRLRSSQTGEPDTARQEGADGHGNANAYNATGLQADAIIRVPTPGPMWDTRYHFFDGTERTVNWLLLLDALNFCFWAESGQPRWSISLRAA